MPRKKPASADALSADMADGVNELNFEQAIDELESIVSRMEAGELSLEASLQAYQRGAALVGRCRESLDSVQQQVKVLEQGLLKPHEDPIDRGAAE